MKRDNKHLQVTLDNAGRNEALRLAFVVFIKMQPKAFRAKFIAAYRKQAVIWHELALSTPNPDNWIDSFESHADRLTQLIEG